MSLHHERLLQALLSTFPGHKHAYFSFMTEVKHVDMTVYDHLMMACDVKGYTIV